MLCVACWLVQVPDFSRCTQAPPSLNGTFEANAFANGTASQLPQKSLAGTAFDAQGDPHACFALRPAFLMYGDVQSSEPAAPHVCHEQKCIFAATAENVFWQISCTRLALPEHIA
jgi:hypothetical protein